MVLGTGGGQKLSLRVQEGGKYRLYGGVNCCLFNNKSYRERGVVSHLMKLISFLTAHNAVVTSAIFAPHPDLIAPQEAGSETTGDAECKDDSPDDSEPIPSGTRGHAVHPACA